LVPGSARRAIDVFLQEPEGLEVSAPEAHAFDMLMQDLTAQIAQATHDREEKAESKAMALQAEAGVEGDLKDTSDTRDADQKCLDDLVTACERKASDCESRQQLRTEEF
jgi:hypothetical protein